MFHHDLTITKTFCVKIYFSYLYVLKYEKNNDKTKKQQQKNLNKTSIKAEDYFTVPGLLGLDNHGGRV